MKKLLLTLMIGLAACGGNVTPTVTLLPPPVTVATFTPLPPAVATRTAQAPRASPLPLPTPSEPINLTLIASDQVQLAATFYPPITDKAPGVLLVHMLGGCACRKDWDPFARVLQKRGFAALALDLRGHGDSPGPEDWVNKSPGDVLAAWDALTHRPEVDPKSSAIVGASIGANLALIVGANNPDVVAVVALSPGEDYNGLRPLGVLATSPSRPRAPSCSSPARKTPTPTMASRKWRRNSQRSIHFFSASRFTPTYHLSLAPDHQHRPIHG